MAADQKGARNFLFCAQANGSSSGAVTPVENGSDLIAAVGQVMLFANQITHQNFAVHVLK